MYTDVLGVSDGCQTDSKWRQIGERAAALNIKLSRPTIYQQISTGIGTLSPTRSPTITAKDHRDRVSWPWVGFVRFRFIGNGGGSAFGGTSLVLLWLMGSLRFSFTVFSHTPDAGHHHHLRDIAAYTHSLEPHHFFSILTRIRRPSVPSTMLQQV